MAFQGTAKEDSTENRVADLPLKCSSAPVRVVLPPPLFIIAREVATGSA
jgi:hypothetical protein